MVAIRSPDPVVDFSPVLVTSLNFVALAFEQSSPENGLLRYPISTCNYTTNLLRILCDGHLLNTLKEV